MMDNNQYFDESGNRVKLDTRFIEKHGNPSRTHRLTERQQQSVLRSILSVAMFGFCAWFIFCHSAVLWRQFHTILEFIGVMACGTYMAICVEKTIKRLEE